MEANLYAPYNMAANVNAPMANVNAPMAVAPVPHYPCYTSPGYGYCGPVRGHDSFVLIVVLFILLIIVGACYCYK